MASPGPTDASLLGDRRRPAESYSLFYRRHARGVLAYCARRGLLAQDAADATTDVFIAAMIGRHRFADDHAGSAIPWLYGIASNVVLGRHRRAAREQAAQLRMARSRNDLTERDIADYAELRSQVVAALEVIDELPEPQRVAIVGRHLHQADYPELASHHGVSEAVVRQRVSRGLATVRQRLTAC